MELAVSTGCEPKQVVMLMMMVVVVVMVMVIFQVIINCLGLKRSWQDLTKHIHKHPTSGFLSE
jgi:cell division protein FtsL